MKTTNAIQGGNARGTSLLSTASVNVSDGAQLRFQSNGNTTTGRGSNFDGINVTGTLDFTGATSLDLVFNFTGSGVNWNDTFCDSSYLDTDGWLIYSGASPLTNFDNLSIATSNWEDGLTNLFNTSLAGSTFGLFQNGNDIYLNFSAASTTNVIPEPASALMVFLLLGGGTLLRSRRRA